MTVLAFFDIKSHLESTILFPKSPDLSYALLLNDDICLTFLYTSKGQLMKIEDNDPNCYKEKLTQYLTTTFY